jgi:histidinol-phosphate aminotransferase
VSDILRHVQPWLREAPLFAVGEPPVDALRLDLNEGAYGPTPAALRAIAERAVTGNRYPDPDGAHGLRAALAAHLGVPGDHLLFGAGSNSLGSLLVRIAVGVGGRVAYSWPGFPTYGWSAKRTGGIAVPVPVREDGTDDLAALAAAARDADVVVLATPANPTGRYVATGLEEFVREASRHALVIVDEAYHEYAPPAVSGLDLLKAGHELVVLRTFSKAWGLAGVRVGYAIMPPALRDVARAAQDTFEVSSLAFAAATASLADLDEIARRAAENAAVRDAIEAALAAAGVPYWPSAANFVCAQPADPEGFTRRLADQGIVVRVIGAFGDPTRVRIGVPAAEHRDRVLAAIAAAAR